SSILTSTDGGNTFKLVHYDVADQLTPGGVIDMVFPNNGNVGYAIDKDWVLKTTDKGQTWKINHLLVGTGYAIEAVNSNCVYVMCNGQSAFKLSKTTDGGASWQVIGMPVGNVELGCAYFLTESTGWISLYNTTD